MLPEDESRADTSFHPDKTLEECSDDERSNPLYSVSFSGDEDPDSEDQNYMDAMFADVQARVKAEVEAMELAEVEMSADPSSPQAKRLRKETESKVSGTEYLKVMESDDSDSDLGPVIDRESEDFKEYWRLVSESDGYDCGLFDFMFFNMICQESEKAHEDVRVKYLCPAIDTYNKEQNRNLVFDSIEKVNSLVATFLMYITFKVKDMDDGGILKTFQCRLYGLKIEQFREKPTTAK